jgi:hypothetical protein
MTKIGGDLVHVHVLEKRTQEENMLAPETNTNRSSMIEDFVEFKSGNKVVTFLSISSFFLAIFFSHMVIFLRNALCSFFFAASSFSAD